MNDEVNIHNIGSQEDFDALCNKVTSMHKSLVVHFKASWCEPCKQVTRLLQEQIKTFSTCVVFAEVDVEKCEEVVAREQITSVPFICFYRYNQTNSELERIGDIPGAKVDLIKNYLKSLFGEEVNGTLCTRKSFLLLNDYLKYLTSRPGIVIFITGTPSRPQCGFTRRLCDMLHELGASYTFFDIMSDNDVCEGLKTFSDWPTFPQVYVDGELIGGYDICKELNDHNELKKQLKLES